MIVYKIYHCTNFEESHIEYFKALLDVLKEHDLLSTGIDEIIITDDIDGEIQQFSSTRFKQPQLTQSREYKAVGRTVDFDGKKKVIFDASYVNSYNKFTPQIFFEQLIEVYAEDLVSLRHEVNQSFSSNTSLTEVIKIFFLPWSTKVVANAAEKSLSFEHEKLHVDVKMFVDTFKRNIRRLHYKHQEDKELGSFWIGVLKELDQFVRRCLDVKYDNGSFDELQEFTEVVPTLLNHIEQQTFKLIKDENFEFFQIRASILEILKKCFIEVPMENPMKVEITESPKKLFKGNLVDTEPRIVAFMDILGFSSIIEEYDSDKTSNILNELHGALNSAVQYAIENTKDSKAQVDLKDFLEYRMFSDCICISLPYIEFGKDFHIQFQSLSSVVKTYQLMMMQKGFFVRGGISSGSYFSDKNMIFSGGLVNAYRLDKGTPVIAIDKSITERLNNNYSENVKGLFLEDALIYAIHKPNKIFLNPFDLLDSSGKQLDYIQSTIDELIKENEKDTTGPISGITNSLLKMTNTFSKPIFDYAKSQLTTENGDFAKKEILEHVNKQIDKHKGLLSNPELSPKEKSELISIQEKYDFLRRLCLWSLKTDCENEFKCYTFQDNNV